MSYRIDYTPARSRTGEERGSGLRPLVLTVCFFAFFTLLVRAFWPEGAAILRHLLFGEEGESILRCLETIARSMDAGQSLHDAAVGAFRGVIHGH